MSKRGLFARLYTPDQTPSIVNARLPQDNFAGANVASPGDWAGPECPAATATPVDPTRRRARNGQIERAMGGLRRVAATIGLMLGQGIRPSAARHGRPPTGRTPK